MSVGIGTEAAQFLFWVYLNWIFGTVRKPGQSSTNKKRIYLVRKHNVILISDLKCGLWACLVLVDAENQ
jgi:hypothetical protein